MFKGAYPGFSRSEIQGSGVLALRQGLPLELVAIARQTRISVPTLRRLIAAFEALFVIRLIETEGSERKPVLYFEDQGEATALSLGKYDALTELTRFLYANLRVQFAYRPQREGSVFQYRTRGGACVPLCFRSKKKVIGIIPILEENVGRYGLANARSFLNAYPTARILFVHAGKSDKILSPQLRSLGFEKIL